jgi:PCO_ADO
MPRLRCCLRLALVLAGVHSRLTFLSRAKGSGVSQLANKRTLETSPGAWHDPHVMDQYDRREFLSLSLPSFLGVLSALPCLCALATRANATEGRLAAESAMHWEAFLEAVTKEAGKQHLDAWNQDEYVKNIARLASRLHLKDPILTEGLAQLDVRLKHGDVDFHYLERRVDFALCLVQFDVDERIRPHDHPGMTGMILCASGEIETTNFDPIVLPDFETAAGRQLLKLAGRATLKKNDISTLTAKARNIHTLRARKVTQLVDIFTPPYNEEREEHSRWFELPPDPIKGHNDVFEAEVS